jgi:3-dehydroquinate synthase
MHISLKFMQEVLMQRKIIHVGTGRSYDIAVGTGLLNIAGELIRPTSKALKAAVITDSTVAELYSNGLMKSIADVGFDAKLHIFPAGEKSKTHSTLLGIYDFLAQNGYTRSDLIIALGGGVVGDVAGFAAATYMRGIDFVQVPTTLLAQVDSSIGGKTAVDLCEGKNLVGAFWQPRLVVCDPSTLKTLDSRVFSDGMAEAIKHICIRDSTLFTSLLGGASVDEDFICRNIDIKRQVVERDERENGERMLLNFGHTLGHAIEKLYNFETYTHGEAVAIGMVMITRQSEKRGLTRKGTADKIESLLKKFGLPTSCPAPIGDIVRAASCDKKRSDGGITLVLLHEIDSAYLHHLTDTEFESFFTETE